MRRVNSIQGQSPRTSSSKKILEKPANLPQQLVSKRFPLQSCKLFNKSVTENPSWRLVGKRRAFSPAQHSVDSVVGNEAVGTSRNETRLGVLDPTLPHHPGAASAQAPVLR